MNKLLAAGFARLWKSKPFWLGMIACPGAIVCALSSNYHDMKLGYFTTSLDAYVYGIFMLIGVFTAIFAALFLGTEYSDGTVRNKLISGHSRTVVYFSSLVVCFVSSLFVSLTSVLITFAVGIPLFGLPQTPLPALIAGYGCGILMIAALSGLFTLAAMLITNKPVASVFCTVGFFALLFLTVIIVQRLEAPEMISGEYEMTVDGRILPQEPVPNPHYLRGTARTIHEFLRDLLPMGIGMQLNSSGTLQHPLQSCLLAVFVTAATTAGGILAFRKKDLK